MDRHMAGASFHFGGTYQDRDRCTSETDHATGCPPPFDAKSQHCRKRFAVYLSHPVFGDAAVVDTLVAAMLRWPSRGQTDGPLDGPHNLFRWDGYVDTNGTQCEGFGPLPLFCQEALRSKRPGPTYDHARAKMLAYHALLRCQCKLGGGGALGCSVDAAGG